VEKMIYEQFNAGDARILIWEISESVEDLISALSNFDVYAADFKKPGTTNRQLEFLSVRVALNQLVGREVTVIYDINGKPFLKDKSFYISISHTKNLVAVMVHPSKRVGIDIETVSDRVLKVRNKFLSADELNHLYSDDENTKKLQIGWSAKEAVYKIIGPEAVDFKNQLRILPFESKSAGVLFVEHLPTNNVFELSYKNTQQFNLAYCIE